MKQASRIPGVRTSIDIEDLVSWAYREELPKQPRPAPGVRAMAPGWSSISRFGELLADIDGGDWRNQFGVTPDLMAKDAPHADALLVAEAVESMVDIAVEVPECWWPFDDFARPEEWGDIGRHVVADALARQCRPGPNGGLFAKNRPSAMVHRYAILGSCPVWEAEAPVYQRVRGPNGKARWFITRKVPVTVEGKIVAYNDVEMDGWNGTRRRPWPGAYHKWELSPSPFEAACDRLDYEVWHAGLTLLARQLEGRLESWVVTGPARAARPWEGEDQAAAPRILPAARGLSAIDA